MTDEPKEFWLKLSKTYTTTEMEIRGIDALMARKGALTPAQVAFFEQRRRALKTIQHGIVSAIATDSEDPNAVEIVEGNESLSSHPRLAFIVDRRGAPPL